MKRFAVIGDPVDHSLSPAMHAAAFKALGLRADYIAVRVPLDGLEDALLRLASEDFTGVNVTTPLKEAVFALAPEVTPEAIAAGGVNTLRFGDGGPYGHMTDGIGFVDALRELWQTDAAGRRVLILGSGAAGRAVAAAVRAQRPAALWCWSRNEATAEEIGPPPGGSADLVVSALPASAVVPPEVLACIGPSADIVDLNYRAAGSPVPLGIGGRRTDGLPMLLYQGARAFEWWWQRPAPIEAMRKALGS